MWDEAPRDEQSRRQFSLALFTSGQKFLHEYFDQQLVDFAKRWPDAAAAGLILDLLEFFSRPDGTACDRSKQDLIEAYSPGIVDLLEDLRDLYLIVERVHDSTPKYRLAHDVIAAYVRGKFDESVLPGQRARRILEARMKSGDPRKQHTVRPLEEDDLALVELGLPGMRTPNLQQKRLIEDSNAARAKARRWRTALRAGAGVAGLIIIALIVATWITEQQKTHQQQSALIRALTGRALRDAWQYDETSILVLEEAYELSRKAGGVGMVDVADAFRQILSRPFHIEGIEPAGLPATSARADAAEERVVLVTRNDLNVLDLKTRQATRLLPMQQDEEIVSADIEPSGKAIASASKERTVYLHRA
jgi:hypothetical protein